MTFSDLEWPFHGLSLPSVSNRHEFDESRDVIVTLLGAIAAP